ncbi:programmed cell death 1 ligand 1-like [Clupea harengus]|uniref:Programmed cell death 1 ligand 1-like n=1 Tax=Clupea harengus TaxID=7950 RepID=A0A6P8F0C2_CLUHA|nr:programmed cell death 1 ligand 1-like [Clupea harengus]
MLQLIFFCFLLPASEQTFSEVNNIDAELYENVTFIWKFPFKLEPNTTIFITPVNRESSSDVINLRGGVPEVFHPYEGRVQLLTQRFPDGVVALKMNSVRIPDAGIYQCVIKMPTQSPYRLLNIKLRAPWRDIKKSISVSGEERVLFCEAEGYPLAAVTWTDEHGHNLTVANPTTSRTSEQLWHIVSQLNVNISSSSSSSNYTCTFTDDRGASQSASFVFTDRKQSRHHYVLQPVLILALILALVMLVMMKKRLEMHDLWP